MQDITDRLRAELDERPAPPPAFAIAITVAAGRRAVRRRRVATGGLVLASALALATGWAATTGGVGHGREDGGPVAGTGHHGYRSVTDLNDLVPVRYEGDGALVVKEGWSITERIDDPLTGSSLWNEPALVVDSAAVVARRGDLVRWVILWQLDESSGGARSETEPGRSFPDLSAWVDYEVEVLTTSSTTRLVTLEEEGELRARDGVRVVGASEPLSALEGGVAVRLRVDGDTVWGVAHRQDDGSTLLRVALDYPTPEAPGTLAGFVDHLEAGR